MKDKLERIEFLAWPALVEEPRAHSGSLHPTLPRPPAIPDGALSKVTFSPRTFSVGLEVHAPRVPKINCHTPTSFNHNPFRPFAYRASH